MNRKLISLMMIVVLLTSLTLVGLAKPAPVYHSCSECRGRIEASFTKYCKICGEIESYYDIYVCGYTVENSTYHDCVPTPFYY